MKYIFMQGRRDICHKHHKPFLEMIFCIISKICVAFGKVDFVLSTDSSYSWEQGANLGKFS